MNESFTVRQLLIIMECEDIIYLLDGNCSQEKHRMSRVPSGSPNLLVVIKGVLEIKQPNMNSRTSDQIAGCTP